MCMYVCVAIKFGREIQSSIGTTVFGVRVVEFDLSENELFFSQKWNDFNLPKATYSVTVWFQHAFTNSTGPDYST